ncbi:MAG: Uma2 family endonuclease [Planctomycetaceae bacterium]
MATDLQSESPSKRSTEATEPVIPLLRNGDRLTQTEFLRRYHAMPDVRHAELIEGRVIMPSPVSAEFHGEPHFDLNGWLFLYRAMTPEVYGGDNSTLHLDLDNAPQPDGYLRLSETVGGQSKLVDGYVDGAPELIVEVAASSVSYDLHDKLNAYRRNGVREYVVWRTEDRAIDWFVLVDGRFDPLPPDDDGIYRSHVFPGLWLDSAAVMAGDLARVLTILQQGLADESHQAFVQKVKPSS